MTFDAIYPAVAFIPLADAVVFLGPMHLLPQTVEVQGQGPERLQRVRGALRERVRQEMAGADPTPGEPLLSTADIQSLVDLSNSVGFLVRRVHRSSGGPCLTSGAHFVTLHPRNARFSGQRPGGPKAISYQ